MFKSGGRSQEDEEEKVGKQGSKTQPAINGGTELAFTVRRDGLISSTVGCAPLSGLKP